MSCCIVFDSRDTKLRAVTEEPEIPVLTTHVAVLNVTAQSLRVSVPIGKSKKLRQSYYGPSRIRTEIDKFPIGIYATTPKGPY